MLDVIIIGMGISGISAGLYAKGANLDVMMFESRMPGGILNFIDEIENYAGKNKIKGPDFAMDLFNQVNDANIPYKMEEIKKIEVLENTKKVYTANDVYETKNIIIATGRKPRLLGLPNEEELLGKGLSTCAICDGNFYKGKDVAIVGGGNSALQEALYLSKIVNKIYIIVRGDSFTGNEEHIEEVNNASNIEVLFNKKVSSINTKDNVVNNLVLNDNTEILISGVFIYAGWIPNTNLFKDLNILDKNNYIEVNSNMETNIPGIYGIGDVTKKELYQLVTAASDGAVAVTNISKS